jgi:aromatic-L-amino-acid/L-tryptophan decarboxylase
MDSNVADYLNDLNRELLTRMQHDGEAYLSNAIIGGKYALRACIVNFRTTLQDVKELLPLVVRLGKELDVEMRPTIRTLI